MRTLLLIIITLQMSVIEAVVAADLYSGEVVVPSQSEVDRKEAIPDALIQVLQKLSGQREMPVSTALDDVLKNADRIMRSYRYKNVERNSPDGSISKDLRLVVQFLQPEIDQLLLQAGLPRWQKERPPVQIWAVIEDGSGRKLKPIEYSYAWGSVDDIAAIRGLPISWPELDHEEIQLVDLRLVWGGFTDYLVERGAPADGVAIVAARREGTYWTLRWNLANGVQTWSWRNNDQELMYALAAGIHQMTDNIAAGNSIAASEQGTWTQDVFIGDLHAAKDYIRCLNYLQSLNIVANVEVLSAAPGRVLFQLQLNATPDHLADAFSRGTVLVSSNAGSEVDYVFLP